MSYFAVICYLDCCEQDCGFIIIFWNLSVCLFTGHTKIGYSMYFYTYSSWKGRAVYMEDLYVMPDFRGRGTTQCISSVYLHEKSIGIV